ncbi:MAG: type II toxin-antitoxin system RelE/ParE family toxin [Gallionella sp.]|nr:type II toxin-antitoxin system RelE/ParE family toxin [Gallionella sp.]
MGLLPCVSRKIGTALTRTFEVRINMQGQSRVFYVAKHEDAGYMLHCFHKTTARTAKVDIDLAAKRYKLIGG